MEIGICSTSYNQVEAEWMLKFKYDRNADNPVLLCKWEVSCGLHGG